MVKRKFKAGMKIIHNVPRKGTYELKIPHYVIKEYMRKYKKKRGHW